MILKKLNATMLILRQLHSRMEGKDENEILREQLIKMRN